MKILAIDPGVNTGIAIYADNVISVEQYSFKNSGKYKKPLPERLKQYSACMNEMLLYEREFNIAIIEGVQFWDVSLKSRTAAAGGDLMLLAYIVGMYLDILNRFGIPTRIISPSQWKGQLPDEIVKQRVKSFFKLDFDSPHITSALGMLRCFLKGELKDEN